MRLVQLILCLLSTGFVKSSVLQLRRFEVVAEVSVENKTKECQNKNMSLVTLYDDSDAKLAVKLSSNLSAMPTRWVGLQKILSNSGDIPMCPSTSGLRNCSDPLYFKCNGSGNLTRGVALNWCAAKQHCHYHSLGDLATNESSANTTLWISGKITDNWRWEDGGCSTYRKWEDSKSGNHAAITQEHKLKSSNSQSFHAVCSTGDLRIVVPKEKKTWEEALQYCDTHHSGLLQIPTKDHQASVEQWLNVTEENQNNRDPFWVGLRQSQVFGFWIWKDTMVSTSNWENGMPTLPLSHECGVIVGPQWKWRDHNCLHRLRFICQENIEYMLNP